MVEAGAVNVPDAGREGGRRTAGPLVERPSRPDAVSVLTLRFTARGHQGRVVARYGTTRDAVADCFPLVAAGLDPGQAHGFPWIDAEVGYDGSGYRMIFGWLQVIERVDTGGAHHLDVDVFPVFADLDSPLAAFGALPRWYDAPANPHHPDGTWTAETFLLAIPDVARSGTLTPLAGMRWGYQLTAGKPVPLPLEAAPDAYQQRQAYLTRRYPRWTFQPTTPGSAATP